MDLPKSISEFNNSLAKNEPPSNWSLPLQCLWYDAKNDWESAHNIAQDLNTNTGSWLHAYLHRKEGDLWNAEYWYLKADRGLPKCSLKEEFSMLLQFIIG